MVGYLQEYGGQLTKVYPQGSLPLQLGILEHDNPEVLSISWQLNFANYLKFYGSLSYFHYGSFQFVGNRYITGETWLQFRMGNLIMICSYYPYLQMMLVLCTVKSECSLLSSSIEPSPLSVQGSRHQEAYAVLEALPQSYATSDWIIFPLEILYLSVLY